MNVKGCHMSTLAIVGAGQGLGASVAKRFGREGFSVALIARRPENVDRLAEELAAEGIDARGYSADVSDRDALTLALQTAAADLGTIEVLQYSPVPDKRYLKDVLDTTVDDLTSAVTFSLLGAAAAVHEVLDGMTDLGKGTVLLVNGNSAATPNRAVAGTSAAFAAESAYGLMLHEALVEKNVHVGQLIIPGAIGGGDPLYEPDALAERLWTIHRTPGEFRTTVTGDGEGTS